MEEGPINHNHWKFKYGCFILHILHSLFDKMLYSVYVHSKNNIPILYGSIKKRCKGLILNIFLHREKKTQQKSYNLDSYGHSLQRRRARAQVSLVVLWRCLRIGPTTGRLARSPDSLNHLRSLIVLSTKVNNLPFWKFEFSQERRCYGSVKMVQAGMTHQAVADHFNVSTITISWLIVVFCEQFDPKFGRLLDQVFYGQYPQSLSCCFGGE
jgi:hypothetical protein